METVKGDKMTKEECYETLEQLIEYHIPNRHPDYELAIETLKILKDIK
jgi:hypothetical protein